jgi:hypothetical protein
MGPDPRLNFQMKVCPQPFILYRFYTKKRTIPLLGNGPLRYMTVGSDFSSALSLMCLLF